MTTQRATLPPVLEPAVYRGLWPDLAALDEAGLERHFRLHGMAEGRRANGLADRHAFVALIPLDQPALEIGPFFRPMIRGENVEYFDVLDQEALRDRSASILRSPDLVPFIRYVSPVGDMGIIDRRFANILGSHCIEHQPDLVAHLRDVSRILEDGGRYFLLIPDKRYCFDAFNPETTICDVLDRARSRHKVHELRSVIEHRAMTTHNNPARHWAGDHGDPDPNTTERIRQAMTEFDAAAGGYIDVHASILTPDSFRSLLDQLLALGMTDLGVEQIYPTRRNTDEFWAVLSKSSGA